AEGRRQGQGAALGSGRDQGVSHRGEKPALRVGFASWNVSRLKRHPGRGATREAARRTSMDILLIVLIYVVAIAISTAVFGASLFLVEDIKASSFATDGQAVTWGKCAGIVLVMTVLGFIPFGTLLALVVFFVGVMVLFHKTFFQALLLL